MPTFNMSISYKGGALISSLYQSRYKPFFLLHKLGISVNEAWQSILKKMKEERNYDSLKFVST